MANFGGPKDTRTKRQKLEAMASQSASPREAAIARRKLKSMATEPSHPIFTRRQSPADWPDSGLDTDHMSHEDFMSWVNRVQHDHRDGSMRYGHDPAPHMYVAHNGSDAYGCTYCGRSRNNPRAHHIFGVEAPPEKVGA